MKKTWVITLMVLGLLFVLRQTVFSRQSTQPTVPLETVTGIPTDTPVPTHTPTPTPTNTPTPTQTLSPKQDVLNNTGLLKPNLYTGERAVISISSFLPSASAGDASFSSGQSDAQNNPPPTNTPFPTPTKKEPTTPDVYNSPTPLPTRTPTPTNTPTPSPTPTPPFLPDSLTAQKTTTDKKTTYTLDTTALAEINIVPNAFAAEEGPTDKPLLPQEQQLLAQNASTLPGGILVTLQQNKGDEFITRQDELTVKRGNQLYTISNQPAKNIPSKTTPTTPLRLEINANNVIAQSSMGLSVDPLSGILTVETPTGPQKVSIMPDEALGIVVELKALNAGGKMEPSLLLVNEKGVLIYRISGEKVEKFLGLFPLPVQKQILVSADTGSIVKVELSPWFQFLSIFTF